MRGTLAYAAQTELVWLQRSDHGNELRRHLGRLHDLAGTSDNGGTAGRQRKSRDRYLGDYGSYWFNVSDTNTGTIALKESATRSPDPIRQMVRLIQDLRLPGRMSIERVQRKVRHQGQWRLAKDTTTTVTLTVVPLRTGNVYLQGELAKVTAPVTLGTSPTRLGAAITTNQ